MKRIKLKKKPKSNKSFLWLDRHLNDEYVLKSKVDGFRSRSSYKLIQINEKFKILSNCKSLLDLGCAPGGWLQVAKLLTPENSRILGIDKLKIEKIKGIDFLKKDIFDSDITQIIKKYFRTKVDVLMSDMSPNSSGNKSVDHLRIVVLVERVLEISDNILKPDGYLISKIFQGGAQGELIKKMKKNLKNIKYFKPKASRPESSETYLIAQKN
ncbi:MAG: RlmE family RNA methyltransferase [Pseudomonadota bacterium]|nr:RlmE family RNA methyltransferase [Pseudomonadota bacterium]